MALQADKKRLLLWMAVIGGIIVLSQLVGYQLSFSKRLGSSKKISPMPAVGAFRLRQSVEHAGRGNRASTSLLLDLQHGEGETAKQLQLIVATGQVPAASR